MQKYKYIINQTKIQKSFVCSIGYVHICFVHIIDLHMHITCTLANYMHSYKHAHNFLRPDFPKPNRLFSIA